jgi:hypothetical protein
MCRNYPTKISNTTGETDFPLTRIKPYILRFAEMTLSVDDRPLIMLQKYEEDWIGAKKQLEDSERFQQW